jgi:putative transposase
VVKIKSFVVSLGIGFERRVIKMIMANVRCKHCGSTNVVKYGSYKGVPRLWCNDCGRKFIANNALPKMKTPTEQISTAVALYYDGVSLEAISRQLTHIYGNYTSDATVYDWITRFTKEAIKIADDYKPNVGGKWIADETVVLINGRKWWLFDVIDSRTRFLLATHLARARTVEDVQSVMCEAYQKAGRLPKAIFTDGLNSYVDGIRLTFGDKVKHVQTKPFTEGNNTNLIERMQGTIKSRTKVMRGLKKLKSAELILDGFLVNYNYFRPHDALDGKTPAEVADSKFPYTSWLSLIRKGKDAYVPVAVGTTVQPLSVPMTSEQVKRQKERLRKRKARAKQRARSAANHKQVTVVQHIRRIRRIG